MPVSPVVSFFFCCNACHAHLDDGTQRAKFSEKVHKPSLGVNAINFELTVFNASIWVPWSPSDPKKS